MNDLNEVQIETLKDILESCDRLRIDYDTYKVKCQERALDFRSPTVFQMYLDYVLFHGEEDLPVVHGKGLFDRPYAQDVYDKVNCSDNRHPWGGTPNKHPSWGEIDHYDEWKARQDEKNFPDRDDDVPF